MNQSVFKSKASAVSKSSGVSVLVVSAREPIERGLSRANMAVCVYMCASKVAAYT